jgi:flagella basal body P-ring formation protein FlgA
MRRLRAWAGAAVLSCFAGAAVAGVSPRQIVSGAQMCEAATAAVAQAVRQYAASARLEARCEDGVPDVTVPAGRVSLAAVDDAVFLHGRAAVLLQLQVDGHSVRKVKVPLRVDLRVPQWCAVAALPAGTALDADRFSPCLEPLTWRDQLALAARPLPAGRLARRMAAGDVLRPQDVAAPDRVLRGDPVEVVYHAGALTLQSRGQVRHDARVGEPVQVQLAGGQVLSGRLATASEVQVQEYR